MGNAIRKTNTKIAVTFIEEATVEKLLKEKEEAVTGTFDNYLIAYIDFLGMKEKMKKENSYVSLHILQALLTGVRQKAAFIEKINPIDDFEIKVFSDNIIIAQKVKEVIICDQIISILNLVSLLQFEAFFQFGFPLRGGVTIGELFIDNSVVWGTGLIEAYQMESQLAIYPRVMVSQKVIDAYEKREEKTLNLFSMIKQDRDNCWFINYLVAAPNIQLIPALSRNLAEFSLSCANDNDRVKQKINWIISYFNDMCRESKDRGDFEKCVVPYI